MSIVLALVLALAACGIVAVGVDMAMRSARAVASLRRRERETLYHEGWLAGFECGSGSSEAAKRIAQRKARLGR